MPQNFDINVTQMSHTLIDSSRRMEDGGCVTIKDPKGARRGDEVEQTTFISSQVKTKSKPKLKGGNRKPRTEKPML